MNTALKMPISPKAYLMGEEKSPVRYEYIDGELYAMAGESEDHNQIAGNFYLALRHHLKNSPCRVFIENVKTHIKTRTTERFYYPDLQIKCGNFYPKSHVETQPKLIIEILSPSTERYDRAEKFHAYRQIDSLEEYVLVAQDEQRVEIYRRETNWEWELYNAENIQMIYFKSVDLHLSFADIYENISFDKDQ